jgi:thiol-disulfide isomerase/thioredoxin
MKRLFLNSASIFLITLFAFSTPEKHIANMKFVSVNNDSIPIFLEGYKYENSDGTMFSFNQIKGKILLLDFWATWCGPCIRERPNIVALEKNINNLNFQVITVSIDKNKSKWKQFITEKKWPGIHIITDKSDIKNPLNQMVIKEEIYNGKTMLIKSVPQYYLIDKDLSIEKIKDIKSDNTIDLIKKKLNGID